MPCETSDLLVAPVLPLLADQAAQADRTGRVDPVAFAALKANPVMRLTAAAAIGGLGGSTLAIGPELEAVAAACASTAWRLWNHLVVFHQFCGLLGPAGAEQLAEITRQGLWTCFPNGAGTSVTGRTEGDEVVLDGVATFATGAVDADFAGIGFVVDGQRGGRFVLADIRGPEARVNPTWAAMSLRASATDHIHYHDLRVPAARTARFPRRFRDVLRDPEFAVIDARYREDWVGLSGLWLGWMTAGVAAAALSEACEGIQTRRAIMGMKMVERPTIHVHLGEAGALIAAARAIAADACRRTDARIATGTIPTETDYLDQMAAGMSAARLCDEAMRLILRVLGGNGLRETAAFERRYRDMQAMPLHINAHPDRVCEQYGRNLLGLPTENPF